MDVGVPFGPINIYNPGQAIQSDWIVQANNLTWRSTAFSNTDAIICQGPETIAGYYNQQPSPDCDKIVLKGLNRKHMQTFVRVELIDLL